jgi:hypothetical protein
MTDLSNSSFIPKRGPVKKRRRNSSRRVYVFTLISYSILLAALLGVAGVFLYSNHVQGQFDQAVGNLNDAISNFDDIGMERVIEFDSRLTQAYGRIGNSVSLTSVFSALESATIGTVKIDSLSISRDSDTVFLLKASVITDSFDSSIFQRKIYTNNKTVFSSVLISDLSRSFVSSSGDEDDSVSEEKELVMFKAELEIPLSSVPFIPSEATVPEEVVTDSQLDFEVEGEAQQEGVIVSEGNQDQL